MKTAHSSHVIISQCLGLIGLTLPWFSKFQERYKGEIKKLQMPNKRGIILKKWKTKMLDTGISRDDYPSPGEMSF